jgi:thioesterase domain-containing protein/aryl carrier-like protein
LGGEEVSVHLADDAGAPLATIGSLRLRPFVAEALPASQTRPQGVRPPRRRAGASAEKSLRDQLAGIPTEAREDAVLEFLRGNIAEALGLDSGSEVDPAAPLLSLGFDSLTALQYRNRLNQVTGLQLTISVVLDHPTPAELARFLLSQMALDDADAPAASGQGGEGSLLASLLDSASGQDRVPEFLAMVDALAGFRPTFASVEASGIEPWSVRLAEGPARPALFCVSSLMPFSGPLEYARLATRWGGTREVRALRWPGFAAGEALPADAGVAVELQAAAIEQAAGEAPIVLAGHSSGGAFAYGIAQYLEQRGRPVAALVMIDSYHPSQLDAAAGAGSLASIGAGIFDAMGDAREAGLLVDDARLTASAFYLRLLGQLELASLASPVLLLGAAEAIGGDPGDAEWRPRWEQPHELLEVPGNHLSMMDAQAETTADAISRWLDTALGDAFETQAKTGRETRR